MITVLETTMNDERNWLDSFNVPTGLCWMGEEKDIAISQV